MQARILLKNPRHSNLVTRVSPLQLYMDDSSLQLISEIGTKLGQVSRPKKDFIVKSLRQVATGLSQIEQPSSLKAPNSGKAVKKIGGAVNPLRKNIIALGLLRHNDKDVRLLVAICISELFRILAPEPPFEDMHLKDIFKLLSSIFAELSDTTSPYFSKRVKILEIVARCKCSVIMLDIECNDLVVELFDILFSAVRENHQQSVINDMLAILTDILNEEASESLLDVVLQNLLKEGKVTASVASQLAVSVIQKCSEKLQPLVCGFLTSCSLGRDVVKSKLKDCYHEIIFRIFKCAPYMVLAVIPNLTQELVTDQVDVRIKAVNLIGRLFELPEEHFAESYRGLYTEFLKRFSDKSAEVRISAIQCAKACYISNPTGLESHEVLTALESRLMDFDERVRLEAVIVACDLAILNLKFFPPNLITLVIERLRDKKLSVRKKSLHKLMELYREYCIKCAEGPICLSNHFEQIPCKILLLWSDKYSKEFRAQNVELILAEDLFPVRLSVEERTRHWIHVFSLLTPLHIKALNSILSQKRRLQNEMQTYLAMRKKAKENDLEQTEKRMKNSFIKMSASFEDPSKAEECFGELNKMKDNNVFSSLDLLLDDQPLTNSRTSREKFLKMIGDKHPHFEFLSLLSSKCLFNIFNSEHVRCILDQLSQNASEDKHLEVYSIKLLLTIVSNFPSLVRGLEKKFKILIQNHPSNCEVIKVLAKAGSHMSVEFSDYYPFLEKLCFDGSREQAKFAVSAIASLVGSPNQLSKLCEELLDSLCRGVNVPTVLQSLGCIAQHSILAFESHESRIKEYVYKEIFQVQSADNIASFEETSGCTTSCKLKIFGLKTLVKSFLPCGGSHGNRKIEELLDILSNMLQHGEAFDASTACVDVECCENDKGYIRLAAAKSVLRLSRRWDLHIPPELFRFTILMARDLPSCLSKSFLDKAYKLLKDHALPTKYACTFALASSDWQKDTQSDSFKYISEFIKEYSKETRVGQKSAVDGVSVMDYPAYIVVFLLHVLAHDTGFPPENCQDGEVYGRFCSPLFWLIQALANVSIVDGNKDIVNDALFYLLGIFRAIRRAEDAVNYMGTPKLHMLAKIGIHFVNTLNHEYISLSRPIGSVFLPSALYRANPNNLSPSVCDESFLCGVVQNFQSKSSQADSIFNKHGKKCQGKTVQHGGINHSLTKSVDPSTAETTCMQVAASQQSSLEHEQKRATAAACGSGELLGKSSFEKHNGHVSQNSKAISEARPLTSCNYATVLTSSTKSQVSTMKLFEGSPYITENARAISNITAESSKYCGVKLKYRCPSKIISASSKVDLLCLDDESCETLNDDSLAENGIGMAESNNEDKECILVRDSSGSSAKEMSAVEDNCSQKPSDEKKGELPKQKRLLPERRKRGQKASTDTLKSSAIKAKENAVVRKRQKKKV